ncbi:MAG: bifunctional transaldolase/phosoglucose isomerase [Gemmatimonadota bacterium]|nr:bifunctional transaldolase/phosoglucose isomerase [Gemmatimonadota bacterium]MDE2832527.1 bifunctional transaldolase/phosoglucose isomerase [Gemmatimonadota bacterium]MDE2954870.1 bifunctional transaldolase/phosoglucose isomerase [Gemmatimonadota bacterium]
MSISDIQVSLGAFQSAVDRALKTWSKNGNTARLWRSDATLWSGADEANWLGWLNIAPQIRDGADALCAFAQQVRDRGITDILLLGMGGSSLCPEVLAMTFGSQEGWPRLHVLDSTVPAQVKRFADAVNLETTLCIVASKSGTTTEPHAFCEFFWAKMRETVGDTAGQHFIAITDPGSDLETLARERGFLSVFYGLPEIGGRFSALSNFGMVPAALIGIDVREFLERAVAMGKRCKISDDQNPGLLLGVVLGELAKAGRDKVTLVTSPQLWDLGAWLEQLLAESTGKNGRGLIPVDLEEIATPDLYGEDRVFVYIRLKDDADAGQEAGIENLREAHFPIIQIDVAELLDLGAEFFRWEYATAVAGAVLNINPFDQPNVQESKDFTAELTQAYEKEGTLPAQTPFFIDEDVLIYADVANSQALGTLNSCIAGLLNQIRAGDYVALCAYVDMNEENITALQALRHRIRNVYRVATTLGFGPRFLHSTGQLHKGGPNNVVVVQLTSDDVTDVDIPGRAFTFGLLKQAQALGDASALSSRKRRAIRIHFKTDIIAGIHRVKQAV